MKIDRRNATRIMSQAANRPQNCLLALIESIDGVEQVHFANDENEMRERIASQPGVPLVYNQHDAAMAFMESQVLTDGQYTIEVFQETEGVFGLRAYCLRGKMQQPEVLEFSE